MCLIFLWWICILKHSRICLLVLTVESLRFSIYFQRLFSIFYNHIICPWKQFHFFLCSLGVLFIFLAKLLWLVLPELCWAGVMKVVTMFLTLKRKLSAFHHWVWCWMWICGFVIHSLYYIKYISSISNVLSIFIMKGLYILLILFLHLMLYFCFSIY